LNWAYNTVPQGNVNDREMYLPRGKVLGGSSAINGLYLNRPAKADIEAWHDLLDDMDDADNWTWDSFFASMKKSETFSGPKEAMAAQGAVAFDAGSHGTKGPIHASYPGYSVQWNGVWADGLQNLGIPPAKDTYGGENSGSYISTSSIDPATWKRSYSRSGYLDAIQPRDNYHILPNAHVTRLIFDGESSKNNLTASAVEYSLDGGATKRFVTTNMEVILAGGTIGSPAVLLHSGVGPKDVLGAAGIDVLSELPGVGNHMQDHLLATVSFENKAKDETPGAVWVDEDNPTKNDTLWLSFVNDAVAYVNATRMFGPGLDAFAKSTTGASDAFTIPAGNKAVQAGYDAIAKTTASTMVSTSLGQIELLLVTSALDGTVGITAALQHPYSHGSITLANDDPFTYPLINPNYLSHPSDITILREGLKLARQLGNTAPFSDTLGDEVAPGTDKVSSDADWEDWMRKHVDTEYHPSSTCAMLPLELGGVVDANLKVYGLANVRVADASVPPVAFSCHLMGSTYGLVERAADLIRRIHNVPEEEEDDKPKPKPKPKPSSSAGGDDDDEPTATASSSGSEETGHENGSLALRPWSGSMLVGLIMAAVVLASA
jgi:choline dehydrogenase